MRQTTSSIALEVKPDSEALLLSLIARLDRPDAATQPAMTKTDLLARMPSLHFFSLTVFPRGVFDPLFVIEANFDGPAGPFWPQLEAALGPQLRPMIACCKRPADGCGPLYDAVTAPGSRRDLAPYLQTRAGKPSVYHHGNRGMSRQRVVNEAALFSAVEAELDAAGQVAQTWRILPPADIHARLREKLLPQFAWLAQPAPARKTLGEKLGDWVRLAVLVLAVLVVLTLPGQIAAGLVETDRLVIAFVLLTAIVWGSLLRIAGPLEGTATHGRTNLLNFAWRQIFKILIALAVFFAVAMLVVTPTTVAISHLSWREAVIPSARALGWGIAAMVVIVLPALVLWLRWLERRDSTQDAPTIDEAVMRLMREREDHTPINHMAAMIPLKPGILRTVLVHVGHRGLHLALRVFIKDGYLASMRTIHFAHWAFVNNGARMMFLSNYDLSWETYFDDFIEKAHEGLTLAFGSGEGFPPTRLLIQDGASHGTLFKAWARHSMTVSRYWLAAYTDITSDQIERNFRIAAGLRQPTLTPESAAQWIVDL
ncbi:hypothetical protein [Novosphingobium lentum]|uniref:hypothetical protein n=1 Tax=Novosphingobium lentum TaxID=145287 RepID=UPI000834FF4C|nr:hypothetical protein [Novosphingobium lentum]